jgi:hypothetical protein
MVFHDPGEPYREARRVAEALALAQSAEARAYAATANARGDVVTCNGCKAAEQGGDWGQHNCQDLRADGLCQRQVYVRVTLARLTVDLMRVVAETQASEALMREMIEQLRVSLDPGNDGFLVPVDSGQIEGGD